jgi:DNA-binding MarR family transcriptional regulator
MVSRETNEETMKKAVSGLEAHLGYWLRYVSNHVSHAFSGKLDALGITVAEWVVLRQLYDEDAVAPSAIAERIGMTRGAISKLVDRLIAKSLVSRKTEKDDRRYQSLSLTAQGRALVPKLAALADRNDEEFFGHLSRGERRTIEDAMKDIVKRLALRSVPTE